MMTSPCQRERAFKTSWTTTNNQHPVIRATDRHCLGVPTGTTLLHHRWVLRAADRCAGAVSRIADVAADAFADVLDPALLDLSGQERVRDGGARGTDQIGDAAPDLTDHRVGRSEAALPGMSEYIRVRDYREQQLRKMPNVEVFRESRMTAQDVFDTGVAPVAIATGATWRRDLFDGQCYVDITSDGATVLTPDDIMEGRLPQGPTMVFDGDNYYMAGVIAEAIARSGQPVTYVTAQDSVSAWAEKTSERWRIRTHLMGLGVEIVTTHSLTGFDGQKATLECAYSGRERTLEVSAAVLVTQRRPNDDLYHDILAKVDGDAAKLPFTLTRIGDVDAPAIIAAAVYAGHRYAVELDEIVDIDEPLKHELPDVGLVVPAHWTRAAE